MNYKPKRKLHDKEQKVKLSMRLLPDLDDAIRQRTRRQGDLSRIVLEALDEFTLTDPASQVPDMREGLSIKPTSISIASKKLNELRQVAAASGCLRILQFNAAITAWLAKH